MIGVSGIKNSDGIPSIQSARRVILSTKRPRSYYGELRTMRDLGTLFGNMHFLPSYILIRILRADLEGVWSGQQSESTRET